MRRVNQKLINQSISGPFGPFTPGGCMKQCVIRCGTLPILAFPKQFKIRGGREWQREERRKKNINRLPIEKALLWGVECIRMKANHPPKRQTTAKTTRRNAFAFVWALRRNDFATHRKRVCGAFRCGFSRANTRGSGRWVCCPPLLPPVDDCIQILLTCSLLATEIGTDQRKGTDFPALPPQYYSPSSLASACGYDRCDIYAAKGEHLLFFPSLTHKPSDPFSVI